MSLRQTACLLFFLGLGFWMFLLQNLPFTFGDDLNVIHFANEHSWKELLLAFLSPLTPAFYVHGSASLASTRAFEPILFKSLFAIAGFSPNVFSLMKVLATSLTSLVIFLLIHKATGKKLISFLGALFFLTASPIYRGVAWIADLEMLAELGNVLCALCFLKLYLDNEKLKRPTQILLFLLLILCYWIGMKSKETGRLIPWVSLAFILAHQNVRIFSWLKSHKLLTGTLLLLAATLIPWIPRRISVIDDQARHAISHFQPENLKYVLWANPGNEHVPSDLVHAFGWILSGLFLAACFWIIIKYKQWQSAQRPYLLYFLIWTLAALAGTCLGFRLIQNERYLTVVLVPATCLVFSVLGISLETLRPFLARCAYIAITLISIAAVQYNFDHVLFLRNFYDGINIADWKASERIYEDRFGREPGWKELLDFYRGFAPYREGEFYETRIKEWDSSTASDITSLRNIAKKWGQAYVISFKSDLYPGEDGVLQLASLDTSNGSLYTTLLSKIKKKTVRPFYLYKILPGSA